MLLWTWLVLPLFLFGCYFKPTLTVSLSPEEQKYLQEIIEDFKKSPTDEKFDNVIELSSDKSAILPKVFIWCPIQHYNTPIVCPVHKIPFFVPAFSPASRTQVRMVYDIGGNILLVQVSYKCPKPLGDLHCHRYLSASPEILESLPRHIALRLPLFLHHKSGFSNKLLDYLIVQVCQGKPMMEIEEDIVSLHFREYVRRKAITKKNSVVKEFTEDVWYNFPTNDKLMHVFLWYFHQKKVSYEEHMKELKGTVLLCDCSFTLGKKLVIKKADEKLSSVKMSVDNMFIGLNEDGQVMEWKLGKFLTFEDRAGVLQSLKERLEASENDVSMILDSECCINRAKYAAIFPDVQVKMGIVHAMRRVFDTLPKDHPDSQSFMHKFIQIFNADTVNEARTTETPSGEVIEANLNVFLRNLRGTLTDPTFQVIEELRGHMRRGCLSGIPPGEGTEKIDNLHRLLQKSYLKHLTVVTPEMVLAVLTCIFHTWNCRKSLQKLSKTVKGRRLPIVPIEDYEVSRGKKAEADAKIDKQALAKPLVINTKSNDSGNSPVLVITSEVISYMISRLMHIKELINAFRERFKNKLFDVTMFPIVSTANRFAVYDQPIEPDSPEKAKYAETLKKNLGNFGLEIDNIPGDGNCLFASVILQVNKLAQSSSDLSKHLQTLGLGSGFSEDVTRLRQLCVKELEENVAGYKEWIGMTDEELKKELEQLKEDGFFACNIGDLCIKVCVNLLQVPVIVVTSLPNAPYHPFLPAKFTSTIPAYVAFNHTPPGHYDGTEVMQGIDPSQKCSCGKHDTSKGERSFCERDEKSKCPCVKTGVSCQPFCKCKSCQNQPNPMEISCSCGMATAMRRKTFVGCSKEGARSRCRCVKAGIPCTDNCSCGNCGNDKPVDKVQIDDDQNSTTSESSPKKKRRKRTSFALGSWGKSPETTESTGIPSDVWKDEEIICIIVCREVLEGCKVEVSIENISQIYRYLAAWPTLEKLGLHIGPKDDTQILSKLLALQTGTYSIDNLLVG